MRPGGCCTQTNSSDEPPPPKVTPRSLRRRKCFQAGRGRATRSTWTIHELCFGGFAWHESRCHNQATSPSYRHSAWTSKHFSACILTFGVCKIDYNVPLTKSCTLTRSGASPWNRTGNVQLFAFEVLSDYFAFSHNTIPMYVSK